MQLTLPKFFGIMPLRLITALFMMASCFSPDGGEMAVKGGEINSFAARLKKMKTAEVDTLYFRICRRLDHQRSELQEKWEKAGTENEKQAVLGDARSLLLEILSDSILVCWYETGWDFNGTTTCPRKGNIACGYFVTTVLKQSAFNISRNFLAQQASSVLIETFCPPEKIKTITNRQTKKVFDYMKAQQDGIFLIGLDNHTGFLVKENGKTRFVHSNYLSSVDKVVSEPLEESEIIKGNNFFVIGDLSHSNSSMEKWLNGEAIQ